MLPPAPLDVPIDFVERSWHTEICLAPADLSGKLATLTREFADPHLLCIGFGERQYMMEHDHSVGVMLASLAPSEAVVLAIPLWVPPAEAYDTASGQASVLPLHISRPGADNLSGFIWRSLQLGADGRPVVLRTGLNQGSLFFAASGAYDAFATCNTWTASALRAAGLPIDDAVIFAGDLTSQVRKVAAAQAALPGK